MGKLSIPLNEYAEDETCKQLLQPLTKTSFSPSPSMRFEIRSYWETIDGYILKDSVKATDPSLRKPKTKQFREMVRRTSVSLFPTAKMSINGKSYELYENADEEPPDASMSFLSERGRNDTEIEFTCDVSKTKKERKVICCILKSKFYFSIGI